MELSAVLIVKNELTNIKELIILLRMFSDEIIIVDTGSDDGSVDFLSSQSDIVFKEFKWNNDFSAARNESLKYATKDFVIWFDADDRMSSNNIEKLNVFKKTLSSNKIYFLKLFNSSDNTFSYQIRIFPNRKGLKFIYPVHEQLYFDDKLFRLSYQNIEIIHKGYEDRDVLIKKQLRNIKILEGIEKKDFYILLQIAESYKIFGDYKKSQYFFLESLKDNKIYKVNKELTGFIYLELYKLSLILGNNMEAKKFLHQGSEYGEFFPVIFYYMGKIFYDEQKFEDSKNYFKKFLELNKNKKYINPVPSKLEDACLYFLANSFLKLENINEAKKNLEILLRKYPANKSYLRLYNQCQ